jgi:adenylate cyclase class 2
MQETEAKFFVLGLDGLRMRLQALEAHLIQPRVLETNIRFDLPNGGLRSKGQVLRLRQDTEAKLTYKSGSTVQQGVLSRKEIEFVVEDFEKAKLFLEELGYQKLFYYEKYRTTFELKSIQPSEGSEPSEGFTHIMLDELPYGNFLEIEGESMEVIQAVANKLNLKWDTAIATSYHVLFERLCTKHPELDPKELSFLALSRSNISVRELSILAGDV